MDCKNLSDFMLMFLGFDPILESAKGLADLLEEEKMITPQPALPRQESQFVV